MYTVRALTTEKGGLKNCSHRGMLTAQHPIPPTSPHSTLPK